MGLYLKQQDNRSELQQQLDARLRAKAAEASKGEGSGIDGVEDSAYVEGTKQTTPLAIAWLFIVIFGLAVLGLFIYKLNNG